MAQPGMPTAASRDDMVLIPAGSFPMGLHGDTGSPDGEGPEREVYLDAYLIDRYAVTNRAFSAFVEQTGHVTDAERLGWSFVFEPALHPEAASDVRSERIAEAPWWLPVEGATWCTPEGRGSSVDDRAMHPVVHVSPRDAAAYAAWAGKRLPTEAQWERAARGTSRAIFPWGDELEPGGTHRCNVWQGTFPERNTGDDGYLGTAPVDAYAPNSFGLYQVIGNCWEICADIWSADWHRLAGERACENPRGPLLETGERVIKGGSFLCHADYCRRYRLAARSRTGLDSSAAHTGFRCVAKADAAHDPPS